MKKRYFLILSMVFVILSISCVSAVDNDTDIFKEQNTDVLSINEEDNVNLSISDEENEPVSAISENNSTILTVTNDGEILASENNTDILTVSSSDSVLSSSVSVSSNYKVPTKKQRTFNIGGFKAVLSNAQYKKLFLITSIEDMWFDDGDYYTPGTKYHGYDQYDSGLRMYLTVKTNKYVKVKVKIGKKYYIKKSRVYMHFSYGAGQNGVAYRYMIFLTHKFANPNYDYAKVMGKNAKYFGKCKQSPYLNKLNKSKLYSQSSVYKKYRI